MGILEVIIIYIISFIVMKLISNLNYNVWEINKVHKWMFFAPLLNTCGAIMVTIIFFWALCIDKENLLSQYFKK